VQNFTAGFQPHTQRPLIKRFVWALDHFSLKRLRQRARYRKAKSTVKRKKSKVLSRISRRRRRSGQEALACLAELAPCLAELAPCLVGLAASLSGWIGSSSGRIGVHRCSAHSAQQSLELIAWSNLPPNSFPAPPLRASAFRLRS
jgi:hypothetical protein